jgi:hypothetical protein
VHQGLTSRVTADASSSQQKEQALDGYNKSFQRLSCSNHGGGEMYFFFPKVKCHENNPAVALVGVAVRLGG